MPRIVLALAVAPLLLGGCLYRAGNNLGSGLMEGIGATESENAVVEGVARNALEKELLRQLGQQLGEGLASGAADISPEQRAELEATIEALLATAAWRSGKGLREDVGPEFRRIVRRDIVETFADGVRGELGDSLEETTDRVVDRAVLSLTENLQDPALRFTLAEILRDAVQDAVEGGNPASPGIGVTLEDTLTTNVLDPFSNSVGGVADRVAYQVNESARRTENLLKTIISGLFVVLAALGILYFIRDRQARRARQSEAEAQRGLRSVGAAIEVLDDETRKQVVQRLDTYQHLLGEEGPDRRVDPASYERADSAGPGPRRRRGPGRRADRSDQYLRRVPPEEEP